jgi:hypothetical protein
MSDEDLKDELERLRNENAALKKGASYALSVAAKAASPDGSRAGSTTLPLGPCPTSPLGSATRLNRAKSSSVREC